MDALSAIILTDRYGEKMYVEKSVVETVATDNILEGGGDRTISLHGSRISTSNGGTFFVMESPDLVFAMLCGSEDAEGSKA